MGDQVQWMLKRHRLADQRNLLWDKQDTINNKIFRNLNVECALHEFPGNAFDDKIESKPSLNEGKRIYSFKVLSLAKLNSTPGILQKDIEGWHAGLATQNGNRYMLPGPCASATEEVLVRPCYEEMLDIIVDIDESRMGRPVMRMSDAGRMEFVKDKSIRLNEEKLFLISGQPGIGKTWFLTYVFVMRMLQGKPTIVQVQNEVSNQYAHIFHDKHGSRILTDADFLSAEFRNNSDIWVLANEQSMGFVRSLDLHNWLVVVPSSRSLEIFRSMDKMFGFCHLVMGLWSWPEMAARCLMDIPLLKDPSMLPAWRKKVNHMYHKYGHVPRRVFRDLCPARMQHHPNCDDYIRIYDVYITKRIYARVRQHGQNYRFTEEDHSTLIAINPMTETFGFISQPERKFKWNSRGSFVTVATSYIGEKVLAESRLRSRLHMEDEAAAVRAIQASEGDGNAEKVAKTSTLLY